MSNTPHLDELVNKFHTAASPKQRYEYLLSFSTKLLPFLESDRIPENKVRGCMSQVYITAALKDGKVIFHGDSDAKIVKGIIGFLIEGLNGLSPEDVIQIEPEFIKKTGLNVSVIPSTTNTFLSILKMMKAKVRQLY